MGWREKQILEQQEKINAASATQILKDGDNVQEVEVLAGRGVRIYGLKRDITANVLPGGGMLVSIKFGWLDGGKKLFGSTDIFAPFIISNIEAPEWWNSREGLEEKCAPEKGKIVI